MARRKKCVTGNALLRTFNRAAGRMAKEERVTATEISAGFIDADDGRSYQVFVRICRFSDDLLRERPETGGLLCNK